MNKRGIAWVVAVVMFATFLTIGIAYADSVVVDTFNEARLSIIVYDANGFRTSAAEGDDSGILGGEHDVEVYCESYPPENGEELTVVVDGSAPFQNYNYLEFAANPGATGVLTVTWDGNDTDGGTSLDTAGLGDVSLVDGTNDGLVLSVLNNDHDSAVKVRAYTNSTDWSEAEISLPAADALSRLDVIFPFDDTTFSNFAWTDYGTGIDWDHVGALALVVDGSPDLDFTIDNLDAATAREYGDLPSSYTSSVLDANHIPQALRLGINCDAESSANPSADADGDDGDVADDEDGVQPVTAWSSSGGGAVQMVVTGCDNGCYINGWIDWSGSDSFGGSHNGAAEQIISEEYEPSDCTPTYTFDVPSDFGGCYYARFRICETSGTCNNVTAQDVPNGEIEDYTWCWGPTAITLTDITARSSTLTLALGAVALAAVGLMGAVVILRRRRA